jgi:hypothetical protein
MTRYIVTLEKLCDCGRTVARGTIANIDPIVVESRTNNMIDAACNVLTNQLRISELIRNAAAVADCKRDLCDLCSRMATPDEPRELITYGLSVCRCGAEPAHSHHDGQGKPVPVTAGWGQER